MPSFIFLPDDVRAQFFGPFFRDRICGSLMGGAVGDALGYPVEFLSRQSIRAKYGRNGIERLVLGPRGKALVSDDTQMTLFTANGLLRALTRACMSQNPGPLDLSYVEKAYLDWYYTQTGLSSGAPQTWLRDLPELASRRAPGTTCMSACECLRRGEVVDNYSKGCGGIMRVAPVGLLAAGRRLRGEVTEDASWSLQAGGRCAAFTHKHPMAILPAALLAALVDELCGYTSTVSFDSVVRRCLDKMTQTYQSPDYEPYVKEMADMTEEALKLAADENLTDAGAIAELGEGWTGDEAWAISVFCVARHFDDPLKALVAAVNHNGDSDSTGAIVGNMIGTMYGYEALCEKLAPLCPEGRTLADTLELSDVILQLADDLATGCPLTPDGALDTPEKELWDKFYNQNNQ